MSQKPENNQAEAGKSEAGKSEAGITMARILGYGGLVPFVFLAAASLMGLRTAFAPAPALLIGYGAVILSFVGALHWGVQMAQDTPSPKRLLWSIVPALAGWAALMLPAKMATTLLICGLIICLVVDWRHVRAGQWPAFMGPLRVILTLVACVSLSTGYL